MLLPAFTPFCPKRSCGGRCSRRRARFPRDPRRTTRCRVRGLRLRNPAFRSGHRTIWDRSSGLAQCRTSCRDSVGRSPRARPAPTTCRRDSAPTSAAGGPEVRRLIPGGNRIRTSGPLIDPARRCLTRDTTGHIRHVGFSTRTSQKSGARQCYRSRAFIPSAESPVSARLNAWRRRRASGS